MKTIILYARRNTGMCIMPFLVAKGYLVKVITNDSRVEWMAEILGLEIVTLDTMGEYDLFLSVHGDKIVPMKYLDGKQAVNVHPCLSTYPGKDPISRYIANKDEDGYVSSHYMIEEVDKGEVIYEVGFYTGVVKTHAEFYNEALRFYFLCVEKTLNILGI